MNRFLRNVLSNWSLLAANIVVGFTLLPILMGRLGDDAYGVVVLVNTIAGYSTLLRAGLGGAIVQRVARARGRGDAEGAGLVASGVGSMYLLLGVLAVLAGAVVTWGMPTWFRLESELVTPARGLAAFTTLLLAIQFPGSIFGGILQGLERYDRANIAIAAGLALRTAGLLLLVKSPDDLVLFGAIQFFSSAVEIALAAWLARRSWPALTLRWISPRDPSVRDAGRFGFGNLVLNLSEKIVHDTDPIVVGTMLGSGPVTVYNAGAVLTRYTRMVLSEMTRVLGPTISRQHAGGEDEAERETFVRMSRLALLLALPMTGIGLALGPSFLRVWLGPGYGESEGVLMVLLLAQWFAAPQSIAVSLLWGRGQLRLPAIVHGLQAVLNLGLSLWWIREWGLLGVALGTLVPVLLLDLWWLPGRAIRAVGISWPAYLRGAFARPLALAVPVAALSLGLNHQVQDSWLSVALWAFAGGIVYLVLAWYFGLEAEERSRVRQFRAES